MKFRVINEDVKQQKQRFLLNKNMLFSAKDKDSIGALLWKYEKTKQQQKNPTKSLLHFWGLMFPDLFTLAFLMFLWGPNYSPDTIISTLDYWLQGKGRCKLLLEHYAFLVKSNSASFFGCMLLIVHLLSWCVITIPICRDHLTN